MKWWSCLRWFVLLIGLAGLGGCGDGLNLVAINGQVTYGGGDWPKPGVVYFTPLEVADGQPLRPALGYFDPDGSFSVTSYEANDGLAPGRYRVHVECWEVEPDPAVGMGKSLVPAKFANPGGIEVEVPSGVSEFDVTFDVPKQ